jgi:hypothetical protein
MSSKAAVAATLDTALPLLPVGGAADTFNPLHHPLLFETPRLLSQTSAWLGHIPLAFLLIDLLRPRALVELGTHHGDSYCAFLQAIEALHLDCRATAVDTWRGDPQSGPYAPCVLENLRTHHARYEPFSSLLQSTFDGALSRFPDNSIDLLHLDGLHDYASVRHDFYAWRPKLSDAAVVLFHDTAIHAEPFGVHRLWDELCANHPHFEFPHTSGLGILAIGTSIPPAFTAFLASANAKPAETRALFAALGHRLELLRSHQTLLKTLASQHAAANTWRRNTHQPLRPLSSSPHLLASHTADDLAAAAIDAQNLRDSLRTTRQKLSKTLRLTRLLSRLMNPFSRNEHH